MKRLTTLTGAAAICAATIAPSPSHALSNNETAALAALLAIGVAVAAANHGGGHDSTSDWNEDRHGKPFSPSPGIVCLPRPKQCYQSGALSWRWTQRIFG